MLLYKCKVKLINTSGNINCLSIYSMLLIIPDPASKTAILLFSGTKRRSLTPSSIETRSILPLHLENKIQSIIFDIIFYHFSFILFGLCRSFQC